MGESRWWKVSRRMRAEWSGKRRGVPSNEEERFRRGQNDPKKPE